jgi:hypothetical protein
MRTFRVVWKRTGPRRTARLAGWQRRAAGALLLALALCLAGGVAQAWEAAPAFASGGSVGFKTPNYRGVIAGPPGAQVSIQGASWRPYSSVTLSLGLSSTSCGGAKTLGSYQTDQYGDFVAGFLWPLEVNKVGKYYACVVQPGFGTALSANSFSLLTSQPAALAFSPDTIVAGETLTIIGTNWVPGPQTLNLVIVPCSAVCNAPPVAQTDVVTEKDGSFRQTLTISGGAASGNYYAQAVNSTTTLSATAGPIPVTAQAASSGTPVPGISPTTTATRTTQGSGDSSTTNTPSLGATKSTLKDAVLAAVLGVVALLALVGGLAFFIGRSHGAEAPTTARARKEGEPADTRPGESGRAGQYALRAAAPGARPQQGMLTLPKGHQGKEGPVGAEPLPALSGRQSAKLSSADDYPWDERVVPPAPPEPEPDEEIAPEQGPGGPGYPQSGAAPGAPTPFMPPRRSQRHRPSADRWRER